MKIFLYEVSDIYWDFENICCEFKIFSGSMRIFANWVKILAGVSEYLMKSLNMYCMGEYLLKSQNICGDNENFCGEF